MRASLNVGAALSYNRIITYRPATLSISRSLISIITQKNKNARATPISCRQQLKRVSFVTEATWKNNNLKIGRAGGATSATILISRAEGSFDSARETLNETSRSTTHNSLGTFLFQCSPTDPACQTFKTATFQTNDSVVTALLCQKGQVTSTMVTFRYSFFS